MSLRSHPSNAAEPHGSVAPEFLDEPRTRTSTAARGSTWRFSPERVLVCVDATPFADRLIRTGHGVATTLDAELVVIHVDTTNANIRSDIDRQRLNDAFQLTRELGGRAVTVSGRSVTHEIIRYAHEHNVVKVIVGRSPTPPMLRVLRAPLADRLARHLGTVDIYVISTASPHVDALKERSGDHQGRPWMHYA